MRNNCVCSNGVADTGCTSAETRCVSCNTGYRKVFSQCVLNSFTCNCPGGTPRSDCSSTGQVRCAGCNDGFRLSGESCVMISNDNMVIPGVVTQLSDIEVNFERTRQNNGLTRTYVENTYYRRMADQDAALSNLNSIDSVEARNVQLQQNDILITSGLQIPITGVILKSGDASKIYHLGRSFNEGGFLFEPENSRMKVNFPQATIDEASRLRGTSKLIDNNAVDMVMIEKSSNSRLTDNDNNEVFGRSMILKTAYNDLNNNFPGQVDLIYDQFFFIHFLNSTNFFSF